MTSVTVSIVLHNSGGDIEGCLQAVDRQHRSPDAVVVLDNASLDDGLSKALRVSPGITAIRSEVNIGFAAGQNRAIAAAPSELHLLLNPDCRLGPEFIARAVQIFDEDPTAGSLSGRLLRFRAGVPDGGPLMELPDDVLDSTGMVALRNRRVLDRGSDEPADGHYLRAEYVFGASGAAAFHRRTMLEDVAYDGEYLDESFFAYREDVDLAWRAQLLGWRCRYEPTALGRHRRRVAPGRRRELPSMINRLSVANRWRMIAKNELAAGWRRDWAAILSRDALIMGYLVLREPRSLGAVIDTAADAHRLRARRRDIMGRRRAGTRSMIAWFGRTTALPLLGGAEADGEAVGA